MMRRRWTIVKKTLLSAGLVLALVASSLTPFAPHVAPPASAAGFTPPSGRLKDFAIIRQGAVWHVFSIWCSGFESFCQNPYLGLRHYTSTDLTNWTFAGYVIPPGSTGAWDDGQIWAPSVVEKEGTYYLYYAGTHGQEQKIGLATSTDLFTWTKYNGGANPVVDCSTYSWEYWHPELGLAMCRDPYVTWDETEHQWVMFISGQGTEDGSQAPFIPNPAKIGISTSPDLITWTEYGTIPNTRGYTTAESSHIIKHGSTYYLFMTDNGGMGKSMVYLSSSNLYTGWSTKTVMPSVGSGDYASEYCGHRWPGVCSRHSRHLVERYESDLDR